MCNSENNDSNSIPQHLLEKSKAWSVEEWETYLSLLEVPRRESLTRRYERLSETLSAPNEEESPYTDDTANRLQQAIALLSPKQKIVVQAKYWEGLSEHEIARRHGMARTTVQTHLFRATARLRELMSSKFPFSEGTKNIPRTMRVQSGQAPRKNESKQNNTGEKRSEKQQ